ncbi:MAG: DUF5688 family protein [Bacillota bacterium]|nr:DUF5688 family protein [Bacillota bacterium]
MNQKEFYDEVIEAVKRNIPEELRDELSVELKEVIKNNDIVLHGVVIKAPEQNVVPTIYIEDCIESMPDNASLDDIAGAIIETYAKGMMEAPEVDNLSLKFEDIKDMLQIQVVEASRNMDRLKELVYKPLEEGMVMLAYVVVREDDNGSYRFALPKSIADSYSYDIDKVFDAAIANSMEKNAPVLSDMMSMIVNMGEAEYTNPLKDDFRINVGENMYVLSNSSGVMGASALYYPDVKERIADAFGENYYVLPSSLHEVILVPESAGIEIEHLRAMVKDANRSVVDSKDVLSDKVLMYDRENHRLIEPKAPERSGSERSER